MLDPAVKAFLEPLWSLEEHIITSLLILRKIIPLVAIRISSSEEVERAISLSVVMVEAQETILLLLELLGRGGSASITTYLLSKQSWAFLLDLDAHVP
jgi:hypothetical protein